MPSWLKRWRGKKEEKDEAESKDQAEPISPTAPVITLLPPTSPHPSSTNPIPPSPLSAPPPSSPHPSDDLPNSPSSLPPALTRSTQRSSSTAVEPTTPVSPGGGARRRGLPLRPASLNPQQPRSTLLGSFPSGLVNLAPSPYRGSGEASVYHSLHCQFSQHCRTQPHALALVGHGIPHLRALHVKQHPASSSVLSWTYSELQAEVEGWSSVLWQRWGDLLGLESSFRVGLYLPRSVDSLLLMLTCMRLGVTVVPLDVHYPPVKSIQMIQQARLTAIVTVDDSSAAAASADKAAQGAGAGGEQQQQQQQPASTTSSSSSYPSIAQLCVLAQQAASDPISDLVQGVQLLDLKDIAAAALDAARGSSSTGGQHSRNCSTATSSGASALPHAADTTNSLTAGTGCCACVEMGGRVSRAMFSPAYLLFTSGSTGVSKAASMSHLQLSIHLHALQQRLPLTPSDVFVPMASFCFVAHCRLWSALSSGATLCIPSDVQRTAMLPFSSLLRALHDEHGLRLSVLDTSPAFLRMLMQDTQTGLLSATSGNGQPPLLTSWRRVTLAGEIVTWKLTQALYAQHNRYTNAHSQTSQLQVVNLYGATECASTICAYPVPNSPAPSALSSFVPVGQPLATTSIVLLDDAGAVIPFSSDRVGHVHVGGSRIEVSVGYDRDANQTMQRYARHPRLDGVRLFRTGDMGRWAGVDGVLELVGRSDNMVKVRGQRVELEELESTLQQSELVEQAVVVAHRRDFHDEEETLLAFVVPSKQLMKEAGSSTPVAAGAISLLSPVFTSQRRDSLAAVPVFSATTPASSLTSVRGSIISATASPSPPLTASPVAPLRSVSRSMSGAEWPTISAPTSFIPLNQSSSALLKLASTLRADVGRHHPFYYVPKHFVFVSSLARLPNGKMDRQAGKAAAAEWLAKKDQQEAERLMMEEGDDVGEEEADILDEALTLASASSSTNSTGGSGMPQPPQQPGRHARQRTVDRYADQLQSLTGTERALWAVWVRLFSSSLNARQQVDVLRAVNATKRGADDEVNGADDFDFFALGGDSLLANQLLSHIAAAPALHKEMSVRDVFEHPNLIDMASFLDTSAKQIAALPSALASSTEGGSRGTIVKSFPVPPSVSGVDVNGRPYVEYPLSPGQSGLWFAAALSNRPLPAHHISHLYAVQRSAGCVDDVNTRALDTALSYLIARHEVLRTVFVTNAGGEPRQRVLAAGAEVSGPSALPPLVVKVGVQTVDSVSSVHRVVESIDHTPFDLAAWPLFRVTMVKVKQGASTSSAVAHASHSAHSSDAESDTFLTLTLHHLIGDGWSSGMLLRELSSCYLHFSNPNSARRYSISVPAHPSLPARASMQYAQWQAVQADKVAAESEADVSFWVKELKDAAYLELPYDFTRPLQRSYDGDFLHLELPSSLCSALHALTLSSRVSLFNLLLAGFQLLLCKYSGQEEVVLGTASANRDTADTQQVMGCCINMVACRGVVDQTHTFLQHAKAVQHHTLEALEHGRVPFSDVVSAVSRAQSGGKAAAKDTSRNPLFDVILLLQNQPIRQSAYSLREDGSVRLARVPFRASHSQYDLAFIVEPTGDSRQQLQLAVNYNVQVWRRDTVQRMVDNYLHLLSTLAAAPAVPMSELDWVCPAQRAQVVDAFNAAKTVAIPTAYPAQHFFEQSATAHPDAPAVESWCERWTYAELECKANQVANALLSAYSERYATPLQPDTLIGLYVDRKAGCCMPAAVLGIMKAGAAYVPLDPTYPEARLGMMIQDSDVKLVLTVTRMQPQLTQLVQAHNQANPAELIPATPVLCIDAILSPESAHSTQRPACINSVSDLAYVIYTSGSTGKPKGVMIQHLSVVNLAHFMQPYMSTHPQADGSKLPVPHPRCLQFSSISFDVAVFEWATTFISGGCLCLVESVEQLLGEQLLRTVERYRITTLLASASSVAAVPLNTGPGGTCLVDLSGLSFMSCGSEALQEAVLHRWMAACPAAFFNQYGPTEVTVTSHMCHYQPVTAYPYHTNRVIGSGISNVHSYVVDAHMHPTPIGVSGELYIGGAGVARGYLNRPELTEQRFIANPFLRHQLSASSLVAGVSTDTWESSRLYRTGDVVRWTVAGELEYMGRNDSQVKVRGFRVEIGEIERRILQHASVHTTVVVLKKEQTPGGQAGETTPTLCAFFTWKGGDKGGDTPLQGAELLAAIAQLRSWVGQTLPPYMVPTYFVLQDSIPQTCTGKFDRNLLTAMDIQPYLAALRQSKRAAAAGGKAAAAAAEGGAAAAGGVKRPALLSLPTSAKGMRGGDKKAGGGRAAAGGEADVLKALKTAWATALGVEVDSLDVSDHFFEVGGHSLLTLRVLALLPPHLQPHLSLADVFAHPTLQAQLDLLKSKLPPSSSAFTHSDDAFSTTPRPQSSDDDDVPTTPSPSPFPSHPALPVDVAIIGMAGRFPGASSVPSLWSNLLAGDEAIRRFTVEELLARGLDAKTVQSASYVPACGLMGEEEGGEGHAKQMFGFDAGFFEISPKDAEMLDPQQRHFLEVCHHALEDAGCVPSVYQRGVDAGREEAGEVRASEPTIGVFAGCGRNTYLSDYLSSAYDVGGSSSQWYQLCGANDKDFLCSRVSFKLGLLGPACVVQTACSSSLVAVHSAVASIQRGECEVALAGGVSLGVLHPQGYTYQPDHILSPDGHCRALDAKAGGTMRGQGLGVVVLKPLHLALRDRDRVYCVIKASAINNDGASKASFAAPNPEGQRRVIAQALRAVRGSFGPADIRYVEAHGTGTKIGDVIELSALTRAYQQEHRTALERGEDGGSTGNEGGGQTTELATQYCAIGSVKTNIGHLDAAAGVAGLIKAALSVQSGVIPPTLHYTQPNPAVSMATSPFFVAANAPQPFPASQSGVRRAAVSSFGIGGTNAHVILEEAAAPLPVSLMASPAATPATGASQQHVICWSAKSSAAGHRFAQQLLTHFTQLSTTVTDSAVQAAALADAAYTLQQGRQHFAGYRKAVVASSVEAAVRALTAVTSAPPQTDTASSSRGKVGANAKQRPSLVFFFPGQGSHFAGMGVGLYGADVVFRSLVDECWALVRSLPDSYPTLLPAVQVDVADVTQLWATTPSHWLSPLALFTVEWAVSQRLISLGIQPTAVCGHSLGHFVAATLAGVLSLPRALIMLLRRSHLLHTMEEAGKERGSMLSISAPVAKVTAMISAHGVEVAGVNSPTNTVVAGSMAGVEAVLAECQLAGVRAVKVHTSHAFHSAFIDHILPAYTDTLHALASTDVAPASTSLSFPLTSPCLLADTVTGDMVDTQQQQQSAAGSFDVDYWLRHTRREVRFEQAAAALTSALSSPMVAVEMGPGRTCVTLLQQTLDGRAQAGMPAVPPHVGLQTLAGFADAKAGGDKAQDSWHWMDAVGRAWEKGVEVEWAGLWELEGRDAAVRKASLPLYPFDHSTLHCPPRARPGAQTRLTLALPASPLSSLSDLSPSPSSPSSSSSPSPSPISAPTHTPASIASLVMSAFSTTLGLPLSSLSSSTDFFTSGGDSVSAVSLTAELNRVCGLEGEVQVRTATLLAYSTVEGLCGLMFARVQGATRQSASPVRVPSPLLSPRSPPGSPAQSSIARLRSPSPNLSPSDVASFTHLPRQFGPLYVLQYGSSTSSYLPLVLVHAVGGDILSYRHLTSSLSPHQAVFAFRADSLDGQQPAYTSIPALAARYLQVLMAEDGVFSAYCRVREEMQPFSRTLPLPLSEQLSPSTPSASPPPTAGGVRVALGGHSFGGLVAYEMACQLQAQRRQRGQVGGDALMDVLVERLLLIDTPSPDSLPSRLTEEGVAAYIHTNRIAVPSMPTPLSPPPGPSSPSPSPSPSPSSPKVPSVSAAVVATWMAHQQAMHAYTWAKEGEVGEVSREACDEVEGVLFVRPSERVKGTGEGGGGQGAVGVAFYQGWVEAMASGLTVTKVQGNHLSMMQPPHVQAVASKVKRFTALSYTA